MDFRTSAASRRPTAGEEPVFRRAGACKRKGTFVGISVSGTEDALSDKMPSEAEGKLCQVLRIFLPVLHGDATDKYGVRGMGKKEIDGDQGACLSETNPSKAERPAAAG